MTCVPRSQKSFWTRCIETIPHCCVFRPPSPKRIPLTNSASGWIKFYTALVMPGAGRNCRSPNPVSVAMSSLGMLRIYIGHHHLSQSSHWVQVGYADALWLYDALGSQRRGNTLGKHQNVKLFRGPHHQFDPHEPPNWVAGLLILVHPTGLCQAALHFVSGLPSDGSSQLWASFRWTSMLHCTHVYRGLQQQCFQLCSSKLNFLPKSQHNERQWNRYSASFHYQYVNLSHFLLIKL